MRRVKVRKWLEINGSHRDEVEERLESLRCALRVRGGEIVDIRWAGGGDGESPAATVQYEVSLTRPSASASTAA